MLYVSATGLLAPEAWAHPVRDEASAARLVEFRRPRGGPKASHGPGATAGQAEQPKQQPAEPLPIGKLMARGLDGGETHAYRVELKRGQTLRVDLTEKGADVELTLVRAADQKLITESEFGDGFDREMLICQIEQDGSYVLSVSTSSPSPRRR
ncbi:MAG: hypothetical protein M3416_02830 [Acidobacteriota bacterium]|nr:hypothetical protein [Acidobacteriota bacterium]